MNNYYMLSNGRIRREQNTIFIENAATGTKKPIPVEDVDSLYLFGEVDLNTKLLNFLSTKKIPLHVFNYYGFYSGSYYPREYLHSGYLLVHQVSHYGDAARRLALAQETVRGSAHSMLRLIQYYRNRRGGGVDDDPPGEIVAADPKAAPVQDEDDEQDIDTALHVPVLTDGDEPLMDEDAAGLVVPATLAEIGHAVSALARRIDEQPDVASLMGIEGKMRERYYAGWRHILSAGWTFERRVRRPPDNEVNALISFGNSILYTACLTQLYRTQLTPTISYLHEPGARRFSLALDLSELFKPLIVDRAIFRLVNTHQLTPEHFDKSLDGCFLNEAGRKLFLGALNERFEATIKHRRLGRSVSYRHLIRLECYKLIRHLTGLEPYRAFRAWW